VSESIISAKEMPFCPGCGHKLATMYLAKALEKLNIAPLDVIVVSDIGCCGIVDKVLSCHTIHGLHGRCCALGFGISLGLKNPSKKVIAIQGDGGATIGIAHLMEAARQNIDMTLIVQNNMVYGMTGGQISGLSTCEFKRDDLTLDDCNVPPYDIVELAAKIGASHSSRIRGNRDISEDLKEAIERPGFSLVEISGLCPAYGLDAVKDLERGPPEIKHTNERYACEVNTRKTASLFESIPKIDKRFTSNLSDRLDIILAGSAGWGIQTAGEMLAHSGIMAGLHATKAGDYPITVGTGFSICDIILSRKEINFCGIDKPDVIIVVSEDGVNQIKNRIGENTLLIMDQKLTAPDRKNVVIGDFISVAGRKGATLCAVAYWINESKILPMDALVNSIRGRKHADLMIESINSHRDIKSYRS